MAFEPANIKSEMPPFRWRTLEIPCLSANIAGTLVQAPRPYAYLDVDAHEGVRVGSETIDGVFVFLNTVEENSFPDMFRRFYAAIRDKSAGDMVHPARGFLRARVLSYDIQWTNQERAGCTVTVRWAETRANASTSPVEIDVPPDAKEVARDADVAVEAVRVLYPTTADAPVGTDPTIVVVGDAFDAAYDAAFASIELNYPRGEEPTDILSLYNAVLGDVQTGFISISGRWNRAAGVVAEVVDAVELIQDPRLWPATLVLREAWRAIDELATSYGERDRRIGRYTAPREMPLDEAGALLGARTDDLVALNPAAVMTPWIQKGQVLLYYLS
jgi:hypothetical protein